MSGAMWWISLVLPLCAVVPAGAIPFCGLAVNEEHGNTFGTKDLNVAVRMVGAGRLWHYNWQTRPRGAEHMGAQYVPMIKDPNGNIDAMPAAHTNGAGGTVKSWNEPDVPGEAGANWSLRSRPWEFAWQYTRDMERAAAKGYTEFVAPAMGHDVCWLDHFLKACMSTHGCKAKVTYLAFHRYRRDCGSYSADSGSTSFRDDVGYFYSFYRLMEKYNRRGFAIRGLIIDEFGCMTDDWHPAAEWQQLNYMRKFYKDTIVGVKTGRPDALNRVRSTNAFVLESDALSGEGYRVDSCSNSGRMSGEPLVTALQHVASIAWFSIQPGTNYLFHRSYRGTTELGSVYFNACRLVGPLKELRVFPVTSADNTTVLSAVASNTKSLRAVDIMNVSGL